MSLLTRFRNHIHQHLLFTDSDKLLLAVSGGMDSMVMTELCRQAGFDLTIAHCNFKLRSEESDRDEKFVLDYANRNNIPVLVRQFDTEQYGKANRFSTQVAARELRYQWFNELLNDKTLQLKYLLTAHHAEDNIETLLMNFFKGTGIAGLHGILPKQDKIIRPLLFARKQDMEDFAKENNLGWVEDSSNQSDKYTRNYFRHQLIPLIRSVYPSVENNLTENIKRFAEVEQLYQQSVELNRKKLLEYRGEEIHIPVLKLKKTEPLSTIIYEIFKTYGFSSAQVPDIISLLDSETGKYVQSSGYRILRNRNWLILAPNNTDQQSLIMIEDVGELHYPGGILDIKITDSGGETPASSAVAILDAKEIHFPLILRKWKQGDYFYPSGMKGKKKIARFLIDQKLSAIEKEKVWVIEMDKKIIWVVGRRIDERFKSKENSRKWLRINVLI